MFNVFTSTEFSTILTQIGVIQGELKSLFRLHGKNIPSYTWVDISTLSLRQDWTNGMVEISAYFSM